GGRQTRRGIGSGGLAFRGGNATLRSSVAGTTTPLALGNAIDIASDGSARVATLGGTQGFTLSGPIAFDASGSTLQINATGAVTSSGPMDLGGFGASNSTVN